MTTVSVSDAKNNLSALLREVRGGATVTITDRGVPVACLVAPPSTIGISASAIELAQRGVIQLPEREPSGRWLDLPSPAASEGWSIVQALLDERSEGR